MIDKINLAHEKVPFFLNHLDDKDLKYLKNATNKELEKRGYTKSKLIRDFEKAYLALRHNGIKLYYSYPGLIPVHHSVGYFKYVEER